MPKSSARDRRRPERRADQLEGRRRAFEHAVDHRPAVAEAVAPVAADKRREPAQVLHPERLIDAERAAEPLDILRPHAGIREEDRGRPAGRGVNQGEDADRDEQQERDRPVRVDCADSSDTQMFSLVQDQRSCPVSS